MLTFSEILKDLMQEEGIDAKTLATQIELANVSVVYKWLKGQKGILLPTAVKIADFFQCSLDYLFGRSPDYGKKNYNACPAFDVQFRKVLKEQATNQYKLIQANIVSRGNLNSWLNNKQSPNIKSIIKLADYLGISMDYLIGRE